MANTLAPQGSLTFVGALNLIKCTKSEDGGDRWPSRLNPGMELGMGLTMKCNYVQALIHQTTNPPAHSSMLEEIALDLAGANCLLLAQDECPGSISGTCIAKVIFYTVRLIAN